MVRNPPGLSALNHRLQALQRAGHLRYLGTDRPDGLHAVEVHGQEREYEPLHMVDWLNGFTAGLVGERQPDDQRDPGMIVTVRKILVNPSLVDQVRIRTRLAMEEDGRGVGEFAAENALTVKAVSEALRLGVPGTIGMLAVLGRDPDIRADLAARSPDLPIEATPPEGWREPDVVARLRALGYAHERGVVRWLSPTEVNKAFFARTFSVRVGGSATTVHTGSVRNWLVGVADAIAPDAGNELYAAAVAGRQK